MFILVPDSKKLVCFCLTGVIISAIHMGSKGGVFVWLSIRWNPVVNQLVKAPLMTVHLRYTNALRGGGWIKVVLVELKRCGAEMTDGVTTCAALRASGGCQRVRMKTSRRCDGSYEVSPAEIGEDLFRTIPLWNVLIPTGACFLAHTIHHICASLVRKCEILLESHCQVNRLRSTRHLLLEVSNGAAKDRDTCADCKAFWEIFSSHSNIVRYISLIWSSVDFESDSTVHPEDDTHHIITAVPHRLWLFHYTSFIFKYAACEHRMQ